MSRDLVETRGLTARETARGVEVYRDAVRRESIRNSAQLTGLGHWQDGELPEADRFAAPHANVEFRA